MSPGSEFYPDAEGALQVVFAFAQVVRDAGADDDAFRSLVFVGKSRAHGIRVFVGAQGEAAVAAVKACLQVFFAAGMDVVQREFAAQFAAACFGAVGEVLADADAELVVVCFAVAGFQGVVVGEAAADGGVGFALAQGVRVVVEQFAAGVLVRGEGRCRDGAVGVVRDGVGKVLVDGFFGLCGFRQVGAVFQRVVAAVAPGRGVAVVGVGVGGGEGGARRVVVAV